MSAVVTALLLLVGVVNLLPLVGALSAARIESLYGIAVSDGNLAILMRHRAVLFGIVGGLLIYAAVQPAARALAIAAGLLSMLSFVVIAALEGGANTELRRVAIVDIAASAALALAAVLHFGVVARAAMGEGAG